jgi:hypothetical protein
MNQASYIGAIVIENLEARIKGTFLELLSQVQLMKTSSNLVLRLNFTVVFKHITATNYT